MSKTDDRNILPIKNCLYEKAKTLKYISSLLQNLNQLYRFLFIELKTNVKNQLQKKMLSFDVYRIFE